MPFTPKLRPASPSIYTPKTNMQRVPVSQVIPTTLNPLADDPLYLANDPLVLAGNRTVYYGGAKVNVIIPSTYTKVRKRR